MIPFEKPIKFGLIAGLILVTYSVILYAFDVSIFNPIFSILNLLVTFGLMIFFAIFTMNKLRDQDFDGKFTYLQAFIAGVIVLLIAFYLSNIFSYLLSAIIDPEYMPRKLDEMVASLEGKVPEETIDEIIEKIQENTDPLKNFVKSLWMSPLIAIGLGAILALFVKKDKTTATEV